MNRELGRKVLSYLNPHIADYFVGIFTLEIDEPDPGLLEIVVSCVTVEMNSF